MTARLDVLARILPPPPIEIVSPPWVELSDQVANISFPDDYQAFVAIYGSGTIATQSISPELEIFVPHLWREEGLLDTGFRGFIERNSKEYGDFLEAEDSSGLHDFRVACFPSKGGLLSWGENSNSDMFFWSTVAADPNDWPVVMFERHPGQFVSHGGGMVDFLIDLLEGRHHASGMMRGGSPRWVMNSDWVKRGLSVSSGPAPN